MSEHSHLEWHPSCKDEDKDKLLPTSGTKQFLCRDCDHLTGKLFDSLHCTHAVEQAGFFFTTLCGSSFALTFRLGINSDCVGALIWLSSDVGEVVACCELLPAA